MEMKVETRRNCIAREAIATVIVHRFDGTIDLQKGEITWALNYASTFMDRSAFARIDTRLTEVALNGDVIASYLNKNYHEE